jgi:hypothetical protein
MGAFGASATMARRGRAPIAPTIAFFFSKSYRNTKNQPNQKNIKRKAKSKSKRAEKKATSAR